MSGSGRLALRIDAALLALLWIGSLAAWPSMPPRYPMHFDFAGRPDAWVERGAEGFVFWMFLPVIALVTSTVLRWAPRAARSNPSLWSIPAKREFLALGPARREVVEQLLTSAMAWLTALTSALIVLLQALIRVSASGARVPGTLIDLAVAVYCAVALLFALRVSRRAKSLILDTPGRT